LNGVLYLRKDLALLLKRLAGVSVAALLAGGVFAATAPGAFAAGTLNGQGSTLVAPLEAEWAAAFDSSTGNTVNFQATG
jgi:ABC-type phosphate transport system substrate-binding protein